MKSNNKEDECIICFENKKNNEYALKLHNSLAIMNCFTHCNCNYFIHKTCIIRWFEVSKSCIICKQTILYLNNKNAKKEKYYRKMQNVIYIYYEIIIICKTVVKVLINIMSMYLFIHAQIYLLYKIIKFIYN